MSKVVTTSGQSLSRQGSSESQSHKDVGYTEMTVTIVMPALEKAGFLFGFTSQPSNSSSFARIQKDLTPLFPMQKFERRPAKRALSYKKNSRIDPRILLFHFFIGNA